MQRAARQMRIRLSGIRRGDFFGGANVYDVDENITQRQLKDFIRGLTGIPNYNFSLLWTGAPELTRLLTNPSRTIRSYGVRDGDEIVVSIETILSDKIIGPAEMDELLLAGFPEDDVKRIADQAEEEWRAAGRRALFEPYETIQRRKQGIRERVDRDLQAAFLRANPGGAVAAAANAAARPAAAGLRAPGAAAAARAALAEAARAAPRGAAAAGNNAVLAALREQARAARMRAQNPGAAAWEDLNRRRQQEENNAALARRLQEQEQARGAGAGPAAAGAGAGNAGNIIAIPRFNAAAEIRRRDAAAAALRAQLQQDEEMARRLAGEDQQGGPPENNAAMQAQEAMDREIAIRVAAGENLNDARAAVMNALGAGAGRAAPAAAAAAAVVQAPAAPRVNNIIGADEYSLRDWLDEDPDNIVLITSYTTNFAGFSRASIAALPAANLPRYAPTHKRITLPGGGPGYISLRDFALLTRAGGPRLFFLERTGNTVNNVRMAHVNREPIYRVIPKTEDEVNREYAAAQQQIGGKRRHHLTKKQRKTRRHK